MPTSVQLKVTHPDYKNKVVEVEIVSEQVGYDVDVSLVRAALDLAPAMLSIKSRRKRKELKNHEGKIIRPDPVLNDKGEYTRYNDRHDLPPAT